jgi:hypothetical protein
VEKNYKVSNGSNELEERRKKKEEEKRGEMREKIIHHKFFISLCSKMVLHIRHCCLIDLFL